MLAAVVLITIAILGTVQFASDAIFASAGASGSLPAQLRPGSGVRVYRAIARVAPAPYVQSMLERAAFDRGDLAEAKRYALALPPSTKRSDLLGRIAQAQGDDELALTYYIAADDSAAVDAAVQNVRQTNLPQAYVLETRLKDRLERSSTHPDALAQAYWRLGTLAIAQGEPRLALQNYAQAVQISPLTQKYLLYAGYQSYDLLETPLSAQYFTRAINVDPTSADAYAGAGLVALREGDRSLALADYTKARALDASALGVLRLRAKLQ